MLTRFPRPGRSVGLRLVLILGSILAASPVKAAGPTEAEGDRFYLDKIRPVLEASCFGCHSSTAKKLKGGLLLDSREALLRGGDSGPAVVPGKGGREPAPPGDPARGRPGDAPQVSRSWPTR